MLRFILGKSEAEKPNIYMNRLLKKQTTAKKIS